MKKDLFLIGMFATALTFSMTACSDDDDPTPTPTPTPTPEEQDAKVLDYNATNAAAWGNYMENVARLLKADATTLYNDWTVSYNGGDSYADIFKAHDGREGNNSALNALEDMIDGCVDIASEVGSTKIGDPFNTYKTDPEAALYQV